MGKVRLFGNILRLERSVKLTVRSPALLFSILPLYAFTAETMGTIAGDEKRKKEKVIKVFAREE